MDKNEENRQKETGGSQGEEKGKMTVEQAGKKGGQKVRRLVEEGKGNENETDERGYEEENW